MFLRISNKNTPRNTVKVHFYLNLVFRVKRRFDMLFITAEFPDLLSNSYYAEFPDSLSNLSIT